MTHVGIESLESRRLLSSALIGGTLAVTGTNGSNPIELVVVSGKVVVHVNGVIEGGWALTKVRQVIIDALGGNDVVQVSSSLGVPVTVHGGAGNDTIVGSDSGDAVTRLYGNGG